MDCIPRNSSISKLLQSRLTLHQELQTAPKLLFWGSSFQNLLRVDAPGPFYSAVAFDARSLPPPPPPTPNFQFVLTPLTHRMYSN